MKKSEQQLKLFPKTRYSYRTNPKQQKIYFPEPSLTVQDAKNECDVNQILSRYMKTGVLDHTKMAPPQFGDWSHIPDYQESMNRVLSAQTTFNKLPAKIREKFNNDPSLFLNFAVNPANLPEMVELGLAVPKPEHQKQTTPSPSQAPKIEPLKTPVSKAKQDEPDSSR